MPFRIRLNSSSGMVVNWTSESAPQSHIKFAGRFRHHAGNRQTQTHQESFKGHKRTYKCNIDDHANDQITQQKTGDYGSTLFPASLVNNSVRKAVHGPGQEMKIQIGKRCAEKKSGD